MHLFGCISPHAEWKVEELNKFKDIQGRSWSICNNRIVQRVNDEYVATAPLASVPVHCEDLDSVLDIEAIWPKQPKRLELDMDPSLPPDVLHEKYNETLFGNQPLFFFPKQTLSKTRNNMDIETYTQILKSILLTPQEIDRKYDLFGGETEFIEKVKKISEMVPITESLSGLRIRETQLQVIIGMELISAHCEDNASMVDLHFDRLCIWQAVGMQQDLLDNFCNTVLIPFFKTRAPRKTKHLVRTSRGTIRTRHKTPRQTNTFREIKTPGLLKALRMQNLSQSPEPVQERLSSSTPGQQPTLASRSISHPVYRQQSSGTVEIRFKRSKKTHSVSPKLVPDVLPPLPLSPPPVPEVPSQFLVQATPEKDRKKYLMRLPSDDEEIGSTDSD